MFSDMLPGFYGILHHFHQIKIFGGDVASPAPAPPTPVLVTMAQVPSLATLMVVVGAISRYLALRTAVTMKTH